MQYIQIYLSIKIYSQMYWDDFGEVLGFMNRMIIQLNTSGSTSQYIVEYITIHTKYIPIHLCAAHLSLLYADCIYTVLLYCTSYWGGAGVHTEGGGAAAGVARD